ncbi:Sphingolipid C4-hydroxylase sur2 [Friedmanniomyces endolithicus]|nr:Sphingolipid C4-hydroxylase sur2 [Friedmanniomyces endolithicus]
MSNATLAYDLPPLPSYTLHPLPPLIPGIPDGYLAPVLLVIAYWAASGIFHLCDEWDLFPQYRLHTPAEVLKRNHASRWDVLRDVILQQIIQTATGLVLTLIDPEPTFGKEEYDIAVWAQRLRIAQQAIPTTLAKLGVDAASLASRMSSSHSILSSTLLGGVYPALTQTILLHGQPTTVPAFAPCELLAGRAIYHLLIPTLQFVTAICIVDTWQYFIHRAMHMNKYLYTTIHSRHHRLYVPYAYGALYNHPVEGFFLDTLGAGLAYLITGMTCRQSMWFFTMTTIKTVDDHCGYAFPWDPLQHLTGNNAGYHDVHHQSWGIKTNFSQPFFTFWDRALGTKWVGGDVSARYEKARIAAQRKADRDVKPITGSQATDSTQASSAKPYANEAIHATPTARAAQGTAEPRVPAGKATQQALGSRQSILDDRHGGGGISVLAEETAEEVRAQQQQQQQKPRRSLRKRTTSSGLGLKGFADRVGESLHGKSSGVLGVDSGRSCQ